MNILNAKRLFIAIILDRVGYFAYYEPTKKLCINEYHYVFASFFPFFPSFLLSRKVDWYFWIIGSCHDHHILGRARKK